ncbi:MAG: hypothetical protein HDT33_03240 [Clostridiales bacterium]|nr:hypothetical protein [Clostridiales bacterium]
MADGYGTGGQDPQNNSQQNNTYHYNYSYGSGRGTTPTGGSKPPKNSGDWGEWVGIGFLLFILPIPFFKIIGVFWLLSKLGRMSSSDKRRFKQEARNAANRAKNTAEHFFQQNAEAAQRGAEAARQAADSARQQTQGSSSGTYHYQYSQTAQSKQKQPPKAEPWETPDPAEQRKRSRKQSKLMGSSGKGLIIAGSILTGIFGLGALTVSMPFLYDFSYGYWEWALLIPIVACLMFMGGGISMLASGISKGRRNERYLNYLAYIGANREVALAPMAASFGVPVSKLCKDLRRMLAKGILPTGYLDLAEGKLFLTEMGYHTPEPKREAPPVQEETPQQAAAREDDILREIRQVNDDIPDAAMSAKIDRIEEITGKILKYQKEHPNKEGQLRTFLNYYLPTTLKILRAYAQLDAQGIEGENISAAKKRIEDMMDQVVSGFEKQLDKLFQDDAMDITSDVEVLENMLKKDGLSDEGGITMTL